ncbi:MAG TPA: potassium-transporting ATPase subunit C [Candidatus Dormibacteraeota bacterium]|nr:potassium-transporting ATPase subunit C [Candidatus Dormibacteraeota bacterium]
MLLHLRRSVIALAVLTLICGILYPLGETGLAQLLFPAQANGSLTANGSTLIGQPWKGAGWFHGRPDPYNPMATGPTNLGPTSRELAAAVRAAVRAETSLGVRNPPADLVTTSGSGVDPDISPAAALAQVAAVAGARGLSSQAVRQLVLRQVTGPELGFLGEPTVNVLLLNQALASLAARDSRPG